VTIVGDNIRAARLENELTQRALADKIAIDPMSVSRWERGAVMPSHLNLLSLAEALDRDPAWFYIDREQVAA